MTENHCQCSECADGAIHDSDCSVHNEPAYPKGKCDCRASMTTPQITAAIAEAGEKGEPVAYMTKRGAVYAGKHYSAARGDVPLYTRPQAATDEALRRYIYDAIGKAIDGILKDADEWNADRAIENLRRSRADQIKKEEHE